MHSMNCRHGAPNKSRVWQGAHHRRPAVLVQIHKALDTQGKSLLTTPDEVTLECLTLLRKPHVDSLSAYLHRDGTSIQLQTITGGGRTLSVGHLLITEQGPLACYADVLDAAARRMLPRHLLRRCRILSSLQLGHSCRQRVTITARTGEEAVFTFQLVQTSAHTSHRSADACAEPQSLGVSSVQHGMLQPSGDAVAVAGNACTAADGVHERGEKQGQGQGQGQGLGQGQAAPVQAHSESDDESTPSSSEGGSSLVPIIPTLWRVSRIARDTSQDTHLEPCSGPHPRLPPEMTVLYQLKELSCGNLAGAAAYNVHKDGSIGALVAQLRALVRQPSHHPLLTHTGAQLLEGASPDERTFYQHVLLQLPSAGQHSPGQNSIGYVWRLVLQPNRCWVVDSIQTCKA